MKLSPRDDESPVRVDAAGPLLLRSPRLVAWVSSPGSFFQLLAVIGGLVILGQLVLGSLSLRAALGEASFLGLLWWGLPKMMRSVAAATGSRSTNLTTPGDEDGPGNNAL